MVRMLVLVLSFVVVPAAFGQARSEPFVWVAEGELAVLTRQLAGDLVRVHPLDGAMRRAVSEQPERSILLCGDQESAEPLDLLWRERLSSQGISQVVLGQITHCRGCARRAGLLRELHDALVKIAPEQRPQLDRNLQRELVRLQRQSLQPLVAVTP